MRTEPVTASLDPNVVVTKATMRAKDLLKISNADLAKIIGVSSPTVTRMGKGEHTLDGKSAELAILFIRLYRSLDAIVGGDDTVAGSWMRNENLYLRGKPIQLIQKVTGLTDVINYLDARRAVS